jgi:hypothetical protein
VLLADVVTAAERCRRSLPLFLIAVAVPDCCLLTLKRKMPAKVAGTSNP